MGFFFIPREDLVFSQGMLCVLFTNIILYPSERGVRVYWRIYIYTATSYISGRFCSHMGRVLVSVAGTPIIIL